MMTCPPTPCLDTPTPAAPASAGTALPWPPTGRQIAWKPTGGFFLCPIPYLTLPWALYEHGHLSFLSLRAWCGVLELPERRHTFVLDHAVHYSVDELRHLLQVPRLAPVQAALHRLEEVGLLAWASDRIVCFPTPATFRDCDLTAYKAVQAQLPAWRTWVPAPRRLLRWLARDGTPGLWATAAGVLLRCMWSKGRRCVSGGRIAARWIASGFGVAERTVHRAFDDLQACDWLARLPSLSPSDATQERRYGARTVINLTWDPPVPDPVAVPANAEVATAPVRPRAHRAAAGASGQDQAAKHGVKHGDAMKPPVENSTMRDHNVSPTPPAPVPCTPAKSRASTPAFGADLYPFQEEERPDPVPASPARDTQPPGASPNASEKDTDMSVLSTTPTCIHPTAFPVDLSAAALVVMYAEALAEIPLDMPEEAPADIPTPLPTATTRALPAAVPTAVPLALPPAPVPAPAPRAPLADPAAAFAALLGTVQADHLRAAKERLLTQGIDAAFLIRPALLAEVYLHLAASSATPAAFPPAPVSGQDQTGHQETVVEPGEAVEHPVKYPVENSTRDDQKLSPLLPAFDQNLSPPPPIPVLFSPAQSSVYTTPFGRDFYPLQEQRPDPVPASRAREDRPPGASPKAPEENPNTNAPPMTLPCLHPTAIPADLLAHTLADSPLTMPDAVPSAPPRAFPTARPADLGVTRPSVVPANVPEDLRTAVPSPAAMVRSPAVPDAVPPAVSVPRPGAPPTASAASPARGSTPRPSARPGAPLGIWAAPTAPPRRASWDAPATAPCPPVQPGTAPTAGPPPSLSHVVPADLRDRVRLEVLRQQAITRRWLTGSEADRLTFATAAVHARRVGDNPCALFVALVREQRWELLTDGDEDQARALLRGPQPASAPPRAGATPAPAFSDDARLVRLVLSILRQDGWSGNPFAAMQQQYPAWTRARWDAALAEALGRRVERGMERLGRGLEGEA